MPEQPTQSDRHEVRVAVLLPTERRLLTPGFGEYQLFRGDYESGQAPERAAHRIVGERHHGLPAMSAVLHLQSVEGIHGYALRPANGTEVNLRQYLVKAHDIEDLIPDLLSDEPQKFDHIDTAFIRQCLELPIMAAKLRRQTQPDLPLEVNG